MTVTVPIKKEEKADYDRLIRRVVKQGGMLAKLNNGELQRYDTAKLEETGYGVSFSNELNESPVYVRYGAVLYPLTTEDPELTKLVNVFKSQNGFVLVIQAAPGSVGVTPSRESLSYSERTVETLKDLLVKTRRDIQSRIGPALREICNRYVDSLKEPVITLKMKDSVLPKPTFSADLKEVAIQAVRTFIERQIYSTQMEAFNPGDNKIAKEIMRAAARKHPKHRRMFRRLASEKVRNKSHHEYYGVYAPDTCRSLNKMAIELDLMGSMLRYGQAKREPGERHSYSRNIFSFRKTEGRILGEPFLVLCRGKEQASGYASGKDHKDRDNLVFINVRNFKPARMAELKAVIKTYKFKHEILDVAPPAPKPKKPKVEKPKEKFYQLSSISGGENPTLFNKNEETMITHALVFIDMKTTVISTEMYQFDIRAILKRRLSILQAYPTVALAYGQAQKKALIAAGSRELHQALAEDYLTVKDTPANRFIANAALGELTHNKMGHSSSALVTNLSMEDLRWAKLFTGQKATASYQERKIFGLFALSQKIQLGNLDEKGTARHHMLKIANEAEKKKFNSNEFDYLAPLCQLWGYGRNEPVKLTEDLVETIRFLRKRFLKKTSTEIQPLKEAA